jgi:hypothetical protein
MSYSKKEDTNFYHFLHRTIRENNLENLRKIHFFCFRYNYQIDRNATFLTLSKKEIKMINNKKAYVIFDSSAEGYSTINSIHRFFDILYQDSVRYGISPTRIIFATSNHKDYDNFAEWKKNKNIDFNLKIIVLNLFDNYHVNKMKKFVNPEITEDTLQALDCNKSMFERLYEGKFFTSLSRVNRKWRTLANFVHSTSTYKDYGIFSQGKDNNIISYTLNLKKYEIKDVKQWLKSLPLIADRKDIQNNWAMYPYGELYNRTIFHIANETLQDDYDNTSLFYSEKTFRPISIFQPFLIYGQQYCNEYLENFGYKMCTDWFDFSFDKEKDILVRLEMISEQIKKTCNLLEGMSKSEQMKWRFKNEDVLIHNYETYKKNNFNNSVMRSFFINLDSDQATHTS